MQNQQTNKKGFGSN